MYYKNNIGLLMKNYPKIYKDIEKVILNKNMFEIIETKTNQYTLKIIKNNKSLYLHSKYNPNREAINIVKENYDPNVKNYIIFGLGFGYHVEQLMSMAPYANFYIIEPNKEVFKLALENIDLSNIINNDKVKLYLADSLSEMSKVLNKLSSLTDMKIFIHNSSLRAMPEHLIEVKYLLEEFKMAENSIKRYSTIMNDNFKFNIKNYDENVDVLFNKFNNVPLYIISAGPSLDKNINELAKVKNKGIILSVGRSVRSLMKAGIKPDLIIITDSQDFVYNRQLKDIDIKVPIIVLSTCDKNVMLKYKGHKFIALQDGYELAEEYAKERYNTLVETGGSVATTALDVAIKMGCAPIVFVGQDLAFTNNKTHSKDTFSKDITVNSNLRKVKDINGGIVYTKKNLYIYLRWIQNRIRKEKNIIFIDATEGGARIQGTKILTLKETVQKYSIKNIEEKLKILKNYDSYNKKDR